MSARHVRRAPRRPGRRSHRPRGAGLLAALFFLMIVGAFFALRAATARPAEPARTPAPPINTPTLAPTDPPTPSPTTEPTTEPTPAPTEVPAQMRLEARAADACDPSQPVWKYEYGVYVNGSRDRAYRREAEISFGDGSAYTALEGVVTFRGNNFRDNASYGTASLETCTFKLLWQNDIGYIDSGYNKWTGVGWNGQPVLVRWPAYLRQVMNLYDEYRRRDGLIEVIYGTLDGNIYFLDAETGAFTRDPIRLGYPIKGSVSVDPRGLPLLYVGQGISKANGKTGKIGWRVYSLIDQKQLFFLNGHDRLCFRDHGAFDGVCLVDGRADTVVECAENGVIYTICLNARYDPAQVRVTIDPEVTAYRYKSSVSKELGVENSVAAYGQYAWFCDNSGLLTCLNLNDMTPVWVTSVDDDTDASIALEPEADGGLALYTVNEVDKQGSSGLCTVRRLDALTGAQQWAFQVACSSDGDNGGGGFASPVVGQKAYGAYIYFNICRTKGGGTLYCFDKATGRVVWSKSTEAYSWSSPVLAYREDGTGALILGNSKGLLRMFDPATGERKGKLQLKGNMEGSPAVFGDLLVIGTRGRKIYGVRLK